MKEGYKKTAVGEVPENWEVVKLGDIATINKSSLSNATDDEYEFWYIDLSSVKSGSIELPTEKVKFKNSPSRARRVLNRGDVIMATVRPNLFGYGLANFDTTDFICSTGFAIISAKKGNEGKYIYQYLYSQSLQKQINKLIVGSNYPAINSTDVEGLLFPKPPQVEQQKIAEILSTFDEKIEVIGAQISQTHELKRGLMQRLLTKGIGHTRFKDSPLGMIPESWDIKRFEDETDLITCGVAATPEYIDSTIGIPFLSAQNVRNGKVILDKFNYISREHHEILTKNNIPKKGDILYSRVGANFGEAAVIEKEFEFSVYVSLTLIKVKQDNDNNYVKFLLNGDYVKNLAKRSVFQGAGVPNLNVKVVRKFLLPFPPKEEQQKIACILSAVDEKLEVLQDKKQQYQELKRGLMQQLLTGKIRVTNLITKAVPA